MIEEARNINMKTMYRQQHIRILTTIYYVMHSFESSSTLKYVTVMKIMNKPSWLVNKLAHP